MACDEDDTLDFMADEERGNRFFAQQAVPAVKVQFGAVSVVGNVRTSNQDHFAVVERRRSRQVLLTNVAEEHLRLPDDYAYVMLVADGMGGAASGELASSLAIRTTWDLEARVTKWIMRMNDDEPPELRERVEAIVRMINRALRDQADTDPRLSGMGTTLTAAYTMGPDAVVAHVGDSRAYHLHNNYLRQITRDHTLAQEMVDAGAAVEDTLGYRHILTNCLGGDSDQVTAEVSFLKLCDEDGLLLCSDGLTQHVSNREIEQVLTEHPVPQLACERLAQLALDRGGKDNITAVLARYTILGPRKSEREP